MVRMEGTAYSHSHRLVMLYDIVVACRRLTHHLFLPFHASHRYNQNIQNMGTSTTTVQPPALYLSDLVSYRDVHAIFPGLLPVRESDPGSDYLNFLSKEQKTQILEHLGKYS